MKKTYYYRDEINDDFAGTNIKRKELPADYSYFPHSPVRKFFGFVLYRLIVTPIVFLYEKIRFHQTVKNRKILRKYRKDGYFIYGNHTLVAGDAFTPTLVTFPKKAFVLVNPDAVSVPVVGKVIKDVGGVSLPTQRRGMKNFHDAILEHAKKKHCVVIYPEAHIWPWYTKIRPFKDVSFRYPAETGKPVFCFTNTFHKRKFLPFPKVTTYVDGPFFPDEKLSVKENQRALRDAVYETMTKRSELSTYERRRYIKVAECSTEVTEKAKAPANAAPRPVPVNAALDDGFSAASETEASETLAEAGV